MTLRDLDIDIGVDVDSSEIIQANDYADELIDTLRELDNQINIRVDFDDGGALEELRELKLLVEELDGERIHINVDMDDITNDIAHLRAQLQAIDHHSVDIDIDTAGAHAQLAALQAQIQSLTTNPLPVPLPGGIGSGGFGLSGLIKMSAMVASLMVLSPAVASALQVLVGVLGVLGVAIGAVAGGLLSFVSAVGVAAIGIGGFAALGITTIVGLYDENAKLSAAQKELKKQTDSVIKSWKELSKALQPFTFGAITSGVAAVNTLLDRSEPILKNATSAVDGLFASFNKSLDTSAMQSFFGYLERAVGPLTTNIGNGLGYALQGVLNTITALEPLTNWMAQGFENMMGRFAKWTEGLKGSDKMNSFINSVKTNLESIGGIIGHATLGVTSFFSAFGGTGKEGLDWFEQKMKDFANWAGGLGENEGFQEFLDTIKKDGPLIAGIIGNIASNIVSLTKALSNIGRDEEGNSGVLKWMEKLTDPKNLNFEGFAENFNLSSMFKPFWLNIGESFNWKELFNFDSEKLFSSVKSFDWANFITKLHWPTAIGSFVWDKFISKFNWPNIEGFSWKEFVAKFNWPAITPFSWLSFISKFDWPKLPGFSWKEFVTKFNWPTLPAFSWASFITKFIWPKVSASDLLGKVTGYFGGGSRGKVDGSHSTGLGHVPFDGYVAQLHFGESVLTAGQTEELRGLGVLQGYGAQPTLDTSPLVSTATTSNSHSTKQTFENTFNINVVGGNTNNETAFAVREAMENLFADLSIMMPVTREG